MPPIIFPKGYGDSGMVSAFRPAQRTKPQNILQRFIGWVGKFREVVDPKTTSQQGTPGSASPATYQQTLWSQRFERAALIKDCNELYLGDPRIKKSVDMYVREAVRGGFAVKVSTPGAIGKKVEGVVDQIVKMLPSALLEEFGRGLIVEGDLFPQAVCRGRDLLKLVAMPADSMERNSDDADEIIDQNKAFSQVDVSTWQAVADFPLALMTQIRWTHRSGNRYGTPELVAIRRAFRILELIENSTATRVMTRAARMIHHKIGTKESPGTETEIDDYLAVNGKVRGKQEVWDPNTVAVDVMSNGNVELVPIEGDAHMDKIEFIRYMQNVLGTVLPTPTQLFGLDTESINRDVMKDLRAEWLKSTTRLCEALEQVIRFAIDLALMLLGIDPLLVSYAVIWTTSSIELPSEEITSALSVLKGGGCSLKTFVTKIAQYMGVQDVDAEIAEILADKQRNLDFVQANAAVDPDDNQAGNLKKIVAPTNGKKTPVGAGNGKH